MVGIILILAAIIGIGAYGPAGNFIKSFAVFLVGNIYPFLLFGLFGHEKREKPVISVIKRAVGVFL